MFQATDGIIQNNQPLFILVWGGGSIAAVAATIVLVLCILIEMSTGSLFCLVLLYHRRQGITMLVHLH